MSGGEIPRGAAIAIDDLLDHCAEIKAGQEVVLLAHIDGTCGGDNLVDPQVISWLQAAVQHRGANPSVLWIDEPDKPHAWRIPPVYMAALAASDVFISHSFDLTTEEFYAIRETAVEHHVTLVRNFATNAVASQYGLGPDTLRAGVPDSLSGCHRFSGRIAVPVDGMKMGHTWKAPLPRAWVRGLRPRAYTDWRKDGLSYRPFPEWVYPLICVRIRQGSCL